MNRERATLSFESKQQHLSSEQKLEIAREKIIQSIAENIDLYGITDSIGRLYGTLYFSSEALTLDEMREALGMSKTSMSTGVRTLLETKMVRKVWKKGVRKDLYQAEEDWYKSFVEYFSTQWRDAIEMNQSAISEAEEIYTHIISSQITEQSLKDQAQMDMDKLSKAKEYYRWLEQLIDTFETGKIFDFVPKPTNER